MKRAPRKQAAVAAKSSIAGREDALFARVVDIVEAARGHVTRSVNTAMVQVYWLIGREIVEVEQHGDKRADYGDEVIDRLSRRLAERLGQGFGARTLRRIRQFYVTYPEGSALPSELGGTSKTDSGAVQIEDGKDSDSGAVQIRSAPRDLPAAPRLDALPRAAAGHEPDSARVL